MERKSEQADLIRKLGAFLGPLEDLVKRPDQFDTQARARLFARSFVEQAVTSLTSVKLENRDLLEQLAKFVLIRAC